MKSVPGEWVLASTECATCRETLGSRTTHHVCGLWGVQHRTPICRETLGSQTTHHVCGLWGFHAGKLAVSGGEQSMNVLC